MNATRTELPQGRWHFQHGPMDVVLCAEGEPQAVAAAHEQAWKRFSSVLSELVSELPRLRAPVHATCSLKNPLARRMWLACEPYRQQFITPMAAVAGAVAQELIGFYEREGIARAWVNNGGDIALHLSAGAVADVGVYADIAALDAVQLRKGLALDGRLKIDSSMPVRGVATSGWRGRSLSLGIADSVTVLASTAAQADAAATVVANAVNVHDVRIQRLPANQVRDDSDLGAMEVTVDVPVLSEASVQMALHSGLRVASALQAQGLIWFAVMTCQAQRVMTSGVVPGFRPNTLPKNNFYQIESGLEIAT